MAGWGRVAVMAAFALQQWAPQEEVDVSDNENPSHRMEIFLVI